MGGWCVAESGVPLCGFAPTTSELPLFPVPEPMHAPFPGDVQRNPLLQRMSARQTDRETDRQNIYSIVLLQNTKIGMELED